MKFKELLQDYLDERYEEGAKIDFASYLNEHDLTLYKTEEGFITYKLQGDAALIYDLYCSPNARGHTLAWKLHDIVLEAAKKHDKKVMIGFSEATGKNHIAGLKAMKVAGFQPALKTNKQFIFIKGI